MDGSDIKGATQQAEIHVDDDRRELLKKLGRFTVYTAPATMILLQSRVAAAS